MTRPVQPNQLVETSCPSAGGELLPRTGFFDRRRSGVRDARYDVLVQMLRDRADEDRSAREKRQRWYRQTLQGDEEEGADSSPWSPIRLHRFSAKVPCTTTPEARALLEDLKKRFPGGAVTFPRMAGGRQAVMLTRRPGAEPRQIGWVDQCVQAEPKLCNVRHQGLSVETDGGTLALRFRYPATAARMSANRGAAQSATSVDVTEFRPALDLRLPGEGPSPRLAWITRPELATINALRSRDYEAFYVRFKLEVMAGIWSALSGLLSRSSTSHWHRGSHYTLIHDADATNRRIHERTVDDNGRVVAVGADRIFDAAVATDVLLLYLEGDILADIADIYFTLQSLGSAARSLKEEFFTTIRRFWESAESLVSRYGSDVETVIRMAQRAVPMPAQAPLLKQDWTNLRQSVIDKYGDGARKPVDASSRDVSRPTIKPARWPFASFPEGDVNVGLKLVFREESKDPVEPRMDSAAAIRPLGEIVDDSARPRTRPIEIQNVVLIAERLPAPGEIDLPWVRRHDWILAKVLLDETFRDALESVDREGGTRADGALNAKRERLYEHLKANILHYQRAVWQHEDPQQRCLRYRNSGRRVPLDWEFELESSGSLTIDELYDRLAAAMVDGQFAAYSEGRETDLDQLIDPAGPIGFHGNYAIYRMRPEFGAADLFSMLHFFKSPYLHANPETGEPEVADPEQIQLAEDAANAAADIQVVDVVIAAEPMPAELEPVPDRAPELDERKIVLVDVPETYELILDSVNGIGLLSVSHDVEGPLVQASDDPGLRLRVGPSRDLEVERPIVVCDERLTLKAAAAVKTPKVDEHVITARDDRELQFAAAGVVAAPASDAPPVILTRANGEEIKKLHAGLVHDPDVGRTILARDDGVRLTPVAVTEATRVHERAILAHEDEWLRPSLIAE